MASKVDSYATRKFSVFDLPNVKANNKVKPVTREQGRATKESGDRIVATGAKLGGSFQPSAEGIAIIQKDRSAVFDRYWDEYQKSIVPKQEQSISVSLPNGEVKEGFLLKTTPLDIALSISKGLADSVIIAKVLYTKKAVVDNIVACDEDEDEEAHKAEQVGDGELWDLNRPLVGDCNLILLKFDDPEAKTVFWHSSAHVLGAAVEAQFGSHLTIGPALQTGFYYDSFMGEKTILEEDLKKVDGKANEVIKKKYPFQRLVLSKEQALEMFAANPFKVSLITNKIPDGASTTVYKCGPLIDLCMGPHVPHTGKIKAFASTKASSTNWLGQVQNDPLQRIYGISFPDKVQLKQWQEFQAQAKLRDHRNVGTKQELFFFHQLSPGSCFWLPHGARIYNKLCAFIKDQYWKRGYEEVISPNMFNMSLWEQSGHAQHYKDAMFVFEVENQEFGLKPMNCPGHCLLFGHRIRSYRELPIRIADFGVLHRNELSGALTGLTRVRRFCQDDAHIFCREDQIKSEVLGALDFMKFVYTVFGMSYKLELSTRPAKALGERSLWDMAEAQLADALNEFAGEGQWRVNAGDGAFYGPKIDIKVYDAMDRVHQCATVQLDFQLPIRFDLQYRAEGEGDAAFQRPVMVHRAMLGSVERMAAVLTEHWGGKWPLWVSPRQCMVVPVDMKFADYGCDVQQTIHEAGFYIDVDDSSRTLNKKIREAEVARYNYILVVGEKEVADKTVSIRTRDSENPQRTVTMPLVDFVKEMQQLVSDFK